MSQQTESSTPICVDLSEQPADTQMQAAALLVEEFKGPGGWPTLHVAAEEVRQILDAGFARAVVDEDVVLGWIGGLPEYDGRVWELHPLVVRHGHRRCGLGRALVAAFEKEAACRGGLTATLGTDDDSEMTSLSGVDLYDGLPGKLSHVRDLGRGHPFLFYQRLGYTITGVMPDANGPGRPDIYMSKRLPR